MQPIYLTEIQSAKLKEMISVLYPNEFEQINIRDQYCDLCMNGVVDLRPKGFQDSHLDHIRIHWYEFCMTYLLDKLWKESSINDTQNMTQYLDLIEKPNLVDFLYEFFKKIQ